MLLQGRRQPILWTERQQGTQSIGLASLSQRNIWSIVVFAGQSLSWSLQIVCLALSPGSFDVCGYDNEPYKQVTFATKQVHHKPEVTYIGISDDDFDNEKLEPPKKVQQVIVLSVKFTCFAQLAKQNNLNPAFVWFGNDLHGKAQWVSFF